MEGQYADLINFIWIALVTLSVLADIAIFNIAPQQSSFSIMYLFTAEYIPWDAMFYRFLLWQIIS